MTSERKVEEFLEIESLASKVAEELAELRKEAENHVAASQSFSTAVLSSSVISTIISDMISKIRSILVTSKRKVTGIKINIVKTSCRTAASLKNAARKPFNE